MTQDNTWGPGDYPVNLAAAKPISTENHHQSKVSKSFTPLEIVLCSNGPDNSHAVRLILHVSVDLNKRGSGCGVGEWVSGRWQVGGLLEGSLSYMVDESECMDQVRAPPRPFIVLLRPIS